MEKHRREAMMRPCAVPATASRSMEGKGSVGRRWKDVGFRADRLENGLYPSTRHGTRFSGRH